MSRFRPSSLLSGYVWAVVLALRWTQLQLVEPVATWYACMTVGRHSR